MKDFDLGLFDYQLEAIGKLHSGSILCGDVGTGKSRTALGYYFVTQGGSLNPYKEMKDPCDLYIITTARKRDENEWLSDMAPYLMSTNPEASNYKNKIVVDSWNNIKKYVDVENSFFIFDEQRLVGYGEWVKSFLKISKKNKWILATATPGDVWTDYISVFIANGFYRNKTEFLQTHAVFAYNKKYPKIVKFINQGKLIKQRNEILVNMNSVKETIRHDEEVIVSYDVNSYKKISKDRWDIFEDKPIEESGKYCFLLRKVVNSDSSRISAIRYLCSVHKKVIIFYNYDYELDILRNIEYSEGTKISEWNGKKHQPIPESDRWVYLVQYVAGAEGWNCIETDTIIFFSLSYSYKTTVQAKGRIDRLNTPYRDLFYYTIRSNSPIDLSIQKALRAKKDFNERSFFS